MASRIRNGLPQLNALALEEFVQKPVDRDMIHYLAKAASDVIICDPNLMPPPQYDTPPRTPSPQAVGCGDNSIPTLEEFIQQLVVSSNVLVPTLMSTLVYLTKLKSRLQPMAKGLRCTTHRIFLAALILAAKYLNDSSPKNKHWARYSQVQTDYHNFGFSRTEVNLMEKQLLFLLDWDLGITEEDLYRELDTFLAPIRDDIQAKYNRRMQRLRQREEQGLATHPYAVPRFPTPPSSRGSSRSRSGQRLQTPPKESIRMVFDSNRASVVATPPELAYDSCSSGSSSGSSYASSLSSRQHSRSSTPLSEVGADLHMIHTDGSLYESPVEVVLDMPHPSMGSTYQTSYHSKQLLPYEISADELRSLQDGGANTKRARTGRGVWRRMFGAQA
ncbi:cyclin [Poronia punctata]|nr:cyclin [Poronia punctata]